MHVYTHSHNVMPYACCGRLITAIGIVYAHMYEAHVRGRQTVDRRTRMECICNVRFYAVGKSDQIANEVNLTAFI